MGKVVTYARTGATGVITIDSPPVNALGQDVRNGLLEALEAGLADPQADVLVLLGAGRTFTAGADIREFGKPFQPPYLPDVIARFENAPKPVVAALHGSALGGGFELALGCPFRGVALRSARFGLPEVKIGLLPGAGGTQRLPRLIGVEKALDFILAGDPISAAAALDLGIVDAVEEGDLQLDAGLRFAERVRSEKLAVRPASRRTDKIAEVDPAIFARYRAELGKKKGHLFSPQRCVDAVEAAVTLPFDQGMQRERQAFFDGTNSPQRAGLIHSFFAEREVAKVPGLSRDVRPRGIGKVGVIGAGTMGGGIAMCFANAGLPVTLVEMKQDALDRGVAAIRRNYEATAKKGRLTTEQVETRVGLIRPSLTYDDLKDVDLVIEAAFESMDVKKEIFGKLDRVCRAERSSPPTPRRSTSTRSPPRPAARRTWSACISSVPPM